MIKSGYAFFLVLLVALLFAEGAHAQSGNQNTLLPEIDPQDIEIRSEFRARFPGLRRQPILGFNPRPRVFQIDPNRLPFMETRDQVVANVPVSQLSRPLPPLQSVIGIPERYNGFVKAGFGSFITPEIEGFYTHQLNNQSLLSSALDYRSSDGHLDDQASGFRFLKWDAEYITKPSKDLLVSARTSVNSDFNNLFDPSPQFNLGSTPTNEYLGLNGKVSIKKIKNALESWKLEFDAGLFAVDLNAGGSTLTGEVNEQYIRGTFESRWVGSRLNETYGIKGYAKAGQFETTLTNAQSWADVKAAFVYNRLIDYSTRIEAEGGVQYISDGINNNIYIAPRLSITHSLKETLEIKGTGYGAPELKTIQDHYQANRFLGFNNALRQTYTIGATGEIALTALDGNRIFGGVNYEFINNYNFYQRGVATLINQVNTFYTINSGDASIFKIYAGISQQLVPQKFWFDAQAYVRSPRLSGGGGDIPFEERLGINGAVSFKPSSKVLLESWVDYVGKREDPLSTTDLSAFFLVNFKIEAEIAKNFGAYAKALNLLDEDYEVWQGYTERSAQFFVGITYKF